MINYKPFLLRIAKSTLTARNQMWAEDLVQETFLKAVSSSSQFNGNSGKISSWLASITKNTCIDFNRKKVNQEFRFENLQYFSESQLFPLNKGKLDVRYYLNLLKEREQKALRLKYFFKLSS